MPKKKSTAIYRKLFKNALSVVWERKMLWIFGILAAVISTGGVADVAFRSFKRIESSSDLYNSILGGSFAGYDAFGQYIRLLRFLGPDRITMTFIVIILLAITIIVLALLSQAALVESALSKKELSFNEAVRKAGRSFLDVLVLAFFTKAAVAILLILTTLPILLFNTEQTVQNAILLFVLFVLFFPLIIIVSIISMIALISIVKRKHNVFDAIHDGVVMFKEHWLVSFELGVLLFFVTFLGALAIFVGLVLLSIPFLILIIASQIFNLPFLFILINTIAMIVYTTIFLAFTGGLVAFQYATWIEFYNRARHKTHGKTVVAKLKRLFG